MNSQSKSASGCTSAMVSSLASHLIRLCTWRALLAWARKRATKLSMWAASRRCLATCAAVRSALRGVLHLEVAVVAGVGGEVAVLEVQDAPDHLVQELAVVRDQKQRAAVGAQPALQPQQRIEVQVVGRLIQQQQVRAAHERARQVGAHAQAAGELAQRARRGPRREPRPAASCAARLRRGVAIQRTRTGRAGRPRACRHRAPAASASCASSARSSRSPSRMYSDQRGVGVRQILRDRGDGEVRRARCTPRHRCCSSPRISASSVDLPQPLRPTMPTFSPRKMRDRGLIEQNLRTAPDAGIGQRKQAASKPSVVLPRRCDAAGVRKARCRRPGGPAAPAGPRRCTARRTGGPGRSGSCCRAGIPAGACDSTPSAITSMPRLRPISMMVRTMVASLASSHASRTKDWSILRVPIGNCCSAESEE